MPIEPPIKRAIAFVDGQNLFKATRDAFGYSYPNYGIPSLPIKICRLKGWSLHQARFYTGVPERSEDERWHKFWSEKIRVMKWHGVHVYTRSVRYRDVEVELPDGTKRRIRVPREKGIDIRIALDVIRLAIRKEFDVAMLFSQDQDFSEVADEIREIAREQDRWIRISCAFPVDSSNATLNSRGINNTDWIPFDKAVYDSCIDLRKYV